jgi:cephalosporin-C deacetylase-like acetyl esterase
MDSIYAVLDYFDIKNFAPSVKCPTMMASGLFDETCPPAINFAAYNNISTRKKQFYLMPDTGHSITTEHWHRFYQWVRDYWAKK